MKNVAKLIGIAPQLVVPDVVNTADYYCEVLGFNLIGYVLDPPVYAMVERDGCQIHFGKADNNQFKTNAHFRKMGVDFVIWVPEINQFLEEIKLKNANIIQEITQRMYGKEFLIRDCNGFLIAVVD